MTYPQGKDPLINLSPYHRAELERARGFLEEVAKRHPERIVRKCRT